MHEIILRLRRYVKRKAGEEFRQHAGASDSTAVQQLVANAKEQLQLVQRQAIVYTLFARKNKSIMVRILGVLPPASVYLLSGRVCKHHRLGLAQSSCSRRPTAERAAHALMLGICAASCRISQYGRSRRHNDGALRMSCVGLGLTYYECGRSRWL